VHRAVSRAQPIRPGLVELLACPKCRAALMQGPDGLRCTGCAAPYEVKQASRCS
jgi:hypothetical protein